MRKRKIVTAVLGVILLLALYIVMQGPFLLRPEVPEHYEKAILSQAEGPYSQRLPLMPVLVRTEAFSGDTVRYTICYFPFGCVGVSYNKYDGYNIEKPLLGR